jgi:glyoxylase-like metal-dependent hydrolase (beta-lactamase superfamily II)
VFRRRYRSLDLNVGLVIGSAGALVIDSRESPARARELLRDLALVTSAPIRWLVNTHWHWDHTFGNGEFSDAAIWGHPACRRALIERGEATRRSLTEMVPEDERDEFDRFTIVPPQHLCAAHGTIDLGDRTVEMRYLGRGHTEGDLVLHVPGTGVLFAGDLIEEGAPPAFDDAYPIAWAVTAARLASLIDGPVVPGHGDLMDRGSVQTQVEELEEVARITRAAAEAGVPPDVALDDPGPYPDATMQVARVRAGVELVAAPPDVEDPPIT